MKALITGNLMFFPIELNTHQSFCGKPKQLYIAGSRSGYVFINNFYTLDDIKQSHPSVQEVDLLLPYH